MSDCDQENAPASLQDIEKELEGQPSLFTDTPSLQDIKKELEGQPSLFTDTPSLQDIKKELEDQPSLFTDTLLVTEFTLECDEGTTNSPVETSTDQHDETSEQDLSCSSSEVSSNKQFKCDACASTRGSSSCGGKRKSTKKFNGCLKCMFKDSQTTPQPSEKRKSMAVGKVKDQKKRKSGIDLAWKCTFPWLDVSLDEKGMYCTVCIAHPVQRQGGIKVWSDVPCKTLHRDSLTKHAKSALHQQALAIAATSKAAEKNDDISQAFRVQADMNRMAILVALRGMYWLVKNEVAHTSKFTSLLDMMEGLGLSYMTHFNKGGNANFTSEEIMWEMVKALSDVPRQQILSSMRNSPYFSILIDETTDIARTKQLIIFGRYITDKYKVVTSFLGIRSITDGTASTIVQAIKAFLKSVDVDITRMAGFGSDGAPVMVGSTNGVASQLWATNRKLISVHTIAHRLSLAAGQAAEGIPYLLKFSDLLGQLFSFYANSPVQTSGLKNIQDIVNSKDDCVNLTEAKDKRWLSHHLAVAALRRTFVAVVSSLEQEATERNEAAANGLAFFLKMFKFCATLLMLSDVLPALAKLSKLFQKQVDFSHIDITVHATLDALKKLKETPGVHFQGLKRFLEKEVKKVATIPYREVEVDQFMKEVYQPFLDNVIENLQERFPDKLLMSAFNIFDPSEVDQDHTHRLELLCEHYSTEVSSEDVHSEYQELVGLLQTKFNDLYTSQVLIEVLKVHADTMPNLCKLAAAIAVIPVSTAGCEPGFSTMKRVKTPMRDQLTEVSLENLLMISIEGAAAEGFQFDSACDNWASMEKSRRLNVTAP